MKQSTSRSPWRPGVACLCFIGFVAPLSAEASWWGGGGSLFFVVGAMLAAVVYAGVTYIGSVVGIVRALRTGRSSPSGWLKALAMLLTGLNGLALGIAMLSFAFVSDLKFALNPLMLLPSVIGVALPLIWTVLLFRAGRPW